MPVPDYNADPKQVPFLRWAREQIESLNTSADRRAQGELNTNRGVTATLRILGQNIVDLGVRVTEAFAALTVRADQITSGIIDVARIPTIPQTQVSGTWDKAVSTTGSGRFDGGLNSTGASATDLSLVAGGRQPSWQMYSGANIGLYGYAPSTIQAKMNLQPSPYSAEAFIACAPMIYEYIGQVDIRDNPENPEYDPNYVVPIEAGLMAEHLMENGLDVFVIFRDGVPATIDYAGFAAVAAVTIGRAQAGTIANQQAQIDGLLAAVKALQEA